MNMARVGRVEGRIPVTAGTAGSSGDHIVNINFNGAN